MTPNAPKAGRASCLLSVMPVRLADLLRTAAAALPRSAVSAGMTDNKQAETL